MGNKTRVARQEAYAKWLEEVGEHYYGTPCHEAFYAGWRAAMMYRQPDVFNALESAREVCKYVDTAMFGTAQARTQFFWDNANKLWKQLGEEE